MQDDIVKSHLEDLKQAIDRKDWERVQYVHRILNYRLINPAPKPKYKVGDTISFVIREQWGMPVKESGRWDPPKVGETVTGEIRKKLYWVKSGSTFENKIEEWMYWIHAPKYPVEDWVFESDILLISKEPVLGNPGEKPSRLEVIRRVKPFLPRSQLEISGNLFRGEEGDYFVDLFQRLANTFETMPRTYQTEGTPADDKIIYLHYFSSGSDWYIAERDVEPEQHQAFGYTILNQDLQNAEWGYISIEELKGIPQVELDFHWKPKTFKEVMRDAHLQVPSPKVSQLISQQPQQKKEIAHEQREEAGGTFDLYIYVDRTWKMVGPSGTAEGKYDQEGDSYEAKHQHPFIRDWINEQGEILFGKVPSWQIDTALERKAQQNWDGLPTTSRLQYLTTYIKPSVPSAENFSQTSWVSLPNNIKDIIRHAYARSQ